jgi:hypothetical protein
MGGKFSHGAPDMARVGTTEMQILLFGLRSKTDYGLLTD